ncbi:MAG: prefoldin subunit alpha [Candidatus Micrarchaeia archaeon]
MEEKQYEESIRQLEYLHNIYVQEYNNILKELSNYNMVYEATKRNRDVLDNLGIIENGSILLNLESGTYIKAKIGEIKEVMVYIGSNYLVEKNVEEAKEYLKMGQKKEEELIAELQKQKEEIESNLIDIEYELGKYGNENV